MPGLADVGMQGDDFTSGGSTPGGGGTTVAGGGGGGGLPAIRGNAHQLANQFVQTYQNRLNTQLAAVSTLAKTDPGGARAMLATAWNDFLNGSQQFIAGQSGPFRMQAESIVLQAFKTPSLMQTVDALWNEVGGPRNGPPSITRTTDGSGGSLPALSVLLPGLIAIVGAVVRTTIQGTPPGSPAPPPTAPPPPSGTPPPPGPPTVPPPELQSWFEKYMPWILTGASVAGNIWSAKEAGAAAERAAGITAAAAKEATKFAKESYLQGRQDLAPWRDVGRNALFRISDLTGLQPTNRTIPPDIIQPDTVTPDPNNPQVGPPGVPGLPNSNDLSPSRVGQQPNQIPNLQEMAARYRRQQQGAA